jgi:HD superfamily phosphohydrolase YqeK
MTWARRFGVSEVERDRWRRAALMHDAVKDAPTAELEALADIRWGPKNLLHGPAAARLAEQHGETDPGVLSAIRYHSVGYAGWDEVGRMLYVADYLEPGRAGLPAEVAEMRARVPDDPDGALRDVAGLRIGRHVARAHPLLAETVAFWNGLL